MDSTRQPRVRVRIFTFSSITLIGTMKYVLKFTFRPVETAKMCNKHLRMKSCLAFAGIIIRVSLAYCRIEKACPKELSMGN
jgi:hypothetical protein